MPEPTNYCDMSPGGDTFLPIRYTLRIYDTDDRETPRVFFQAATPFPAFCRGDAIKGVVLPLDLRGALLEIVEIHHGIFSVGDQASAETFLFCEFPPATPAAP